MVIKKTFNWRIVSLLLTMPFILVYLYHSIVLEKGAKEIETKIYGELLKIEPPTMSRLQRTEKYHKSNNALALADFYSDLPDHEIISYYQDSLKKEGWVYCCDDDDQTNKELIFQKNDLTAHLYLKKKRTRGTKAYRLSMAWRLFDCSQCK